MASQRAAGGQWQQQQSSWVSASAAVSTVLDSAAHVNVKCTMAGNGLSLFSRSANKNNLFLAHAIFAIARPGDGFQVVFTKENGDASPAPPVTAEVAAVVAVSQASSTSNLNCTVKDEHGAVLDNISNPFVKLPVDVECWVKNENQGDSYTLVFEIYESSSKKRVEQKNYNIQRGERLAINFIKQQKTVTIEMRGRTAAPGYFIV